ncbi:hypothetical protein [Reyranella sp.]|uniref:hypothetical protein n=1 Tax=Reyranella sp. TaxID=1929291 RepID=UPI004035AA78
MIARLAPIIRRLLGRELEINGERIYIADDGTGALAPSEAEMLPLEHVLGSFLRTSSGRPPEVERVQAWSLAQKKIALEAIVVCQSRISGIDVIKAGQLRRFLVETRDAMSRDALEDLARKFHAKWHEANYLAYVHLRASASATVL